MSVNITNNYTGPVGRMFARQNISSLYGAHKTTIKEDPNTVGEQQVDKVTLSPSAPKPLTTSFLEDAVQTGKTLSSGQTLPEETTSRLREDRVFAALSALTLIGYDENKSGLSQWPGGIPSPSTEEMELARRRLSQRPSPSEETTDVATVQNDRLDLLSRIGKSDLTLMMAG